jgi:hypothetical protein
MSDHPDAVLYKRLRAETIELLGLDPDNLGTAASVKVDLVASLRLALDNFTAQQLAGEKIDTARLLSAAEALERLLPREASFNREVHESHSARTKLTALLDQLGEVIESDKAERIENLEAEVEELKATISGKDAAILALGGTLSTAAPAPATFSNEKVDQPPQTSNQPPLPPRSPTNTPPAAYLAKREPWQDVQDAPPGSDRSRRTW